MINDEPAIGDSFVWRIWRLVSGIGVFVVAYYAYVYFAFIYPLLNKSIYTLYILLGASAVYSVGMLFLPKIAKRLSKTKKIQEPIPAQITPKPKNRSLNDFMNPDPTKVKLNSPDSIKKMDSEMGVDLLDKFLDKKKIKISPEETDGTSGFQELLGTALAKSLSDAEVNIELELPDNSELELKGQKFKVKSGKVSIRSKRQEKPPEPQEEKEEETVPMDKEEGLEGRGMGEDVLSETPEKETEEESEDEEEEEEKDTEDEEEEDEEEEDEEEEKEEEKEEEEENPVKRRRRSEIGERE